MSEHVLCVKSEAIPLIWGNLFELSPPVGGLGWLVRLVSLPTDMFVCGIRPEVEKDESIKQIATYISVISENDILTYRRGGKGEERRLHAKRSVGIGGHVKYQNYSRFHYDTFHRPWHFLGYLREEAEREILEELGPASIDDSVGLFPTGLIYDASNDVGRVHLGVTFSLYLPNKACIAANCSSIEDLQWLSIRDLESSISLDRYESWSYIAMQTYWF